MKNTAYIKLAAILILVGVVAYFTYKYIANLPTPEEKTVIELVKTFKRGNYDECTQYCYDGTFFNVVDRSKVIDTDGIEINWKTSTYTWSEAKLQDAIETYVKFHLRDIDFIQLSTQLLNDGQEAVVDFYADVKVADTSGGEILNPPIHEGRMEGKCFLKKDADGKLKVERFDVTLTSFSGLDLKKYLHRMNY